MPESDPQPIGQTLDQLLDEVIFANPDPRIQRLKQIWDEAKREARELLARADTDNYETRLTYHHISRTANPEQQARADASVLRILLREEYDARLATIWADITRRVNAVLEVLKEEREESENGPLPE